MSDRNIFVDAGEFESKINDMKFCEVHGYSTDEINEFRKSSTEKGTDLPVYLDFCDAFDKLNNLVMKQFYTMYKNDVADLEKMRDMILGLDFDTALQVDLQKYKNFNSSSGPGGAGGFTQTPNSYFPYMNNQSPNSNFPYMNNQSPDSNVPFMNNNNGKLPEDWKEKMSEDFKPNTDQGDD